MFSPTAHPGTAKRSWREAARRAVDLAVAFATLSDELPRRHVDESAVHPHRRPLRAPSRMRRHGSVSPRTHRCTTPVAQRLRPSGQRLSSTTMR
jgi:hypothetical protein